MYVAVRRYAMDPEVHVSLKENLEHDFLPLIRKIDGFVAYYAVDTGSDTMSTVSIFETKEGEEESSRVAADLVKRLYAGKVERISLEEGRCVIADRARAAV